MMRIAVVGAAGQLGAAVVHECSSRHDVAAFDRAALDITDPVKVAAEMKRAAPDVIINCAAYNAVDAAEDHPVEALQANAFAVRALARAAKARGAALVHYSSDFVFDGTATAPYTEEDRPNPRSVYAASKMLGEWFAADAPGAYILRVESLFGRAPDGRPVKGSVAAILAALQSGATAKVFEDRTVTPTYVLDAARATRELVERRPPAGIYHCVNSGSCTWLELAREAARLLGVEPRIQPMRLADAHLRAARPQYCALSNEKLKAIGIGMPTWREALERYVATSRADTPVSREF
jgi:dTDP-4-dehydrorhamnose reductase